MSGQLQLRDYLDNSTEASKRIRTIVTILVVVTVLILAGFLNSWHGYAWNRQRISFQADYVKQLDLRIDQLTRATQQLTSGTNDFTELKTNIPPLLNTQSLSPHYGSEKCEKLPENGATKEQSEKALKDQLRCYDGARKLSQKFLDETVKAYVESAYFIRVPFFGVAFDINDLGAIGGLSLIIILIMLRLNLRNFIVSLRIGFKAVGGDTESYKQFYDVLAGRQLFAFPDLEDSRQDLYEGKTELIWTKSRAKNLYGFIAKVVSAIFTGIKGALWVLLRVVLLSSYKETIEDPKGVDSPEENGMGSDPREADASKKIETAVVMKNDESKNDQASIKPSEDNNSKKTRGWYSNRHPLLAIVPTWICLVPALVYGALVINDFLSYEVGLVENKVRTITSFGFSLLCLVVIFGLGCWCVSKWIEIDQLWKEFSRRTKTPLSPTPTGQVHASDGGNSNTKSATPIASTI